MDTLEAIRTRRSIRQFLNKDVDVAILKQIIEAGMRAPSSKNTQPWHFLVLKGKKKNSVVNIVEEEFPKRKSIYRKGKIEKSSTLDSCKFTKEAPVLILIFNKAPYTFGEDNVINDCSHEALLAWTVEVQSVSAAIENMLLAIQSLGLGACWLADFNFARKRICEYLNCKHDFLGGIALGYPKISVPSRDIPAVNIDIQE